MSTFLLLRIQLCLKELYRKINSLWLYSITLKRNFLESIIFDIVDENTTGWPTKREPIDNMKTLGIVTSNTEHTVQYNNHSTHGAVQYSPLGPRRSTLRWRT